MKLQEHPLWPSITNWARNDCPYSDLDAALDAAVAVDSPLPNGWPDFFAPPRARKYLADQIMDARNLVGVLMGRYYPDLHALVYRMSWHQLGGALCRASKLSTSQPRFHADFVLSTRLPGFLTALEAWDNHISCIAGEVGGEEGLAWVFRNRHAMEKEDADYWQKRHEDEITDTSVRMAVLVKEYNKAMAAHRMREKRAKAKIQPTFKNLELGKLVVQSKKEMAALVRNDKPIEDEKKRGRKKGQVHAEFKYALESWWVSAALWCKNDYEIAEILAPGVKPTLAVTNRINKDIYALGFAASRLKLP